ncbi:hypothetical protein B0H14DRAFT_3486923 [Mycena olivaceomarginata]|nr:hypothetical protein B0H14DRAFT_3486923 [Mycena olivaceomarginata]
MSPTLNPALKEPPQIPAPSSPPGNRPPRWCLHHIPIPTPSSPPGKHRPTSPTLITPAPDSQPHQPRLERAAPRLIPGIPAPSSPAPSAPRPYLLPDNAAPQSSPCRPAFM